jgi:hypothetical protein
MYTDTLIVNERNKNGNVYSYFPNAFLVVDPEELAVFFIIVSPEKLSALFFMIDPEKFAVSALRDAAS